MASFVPYTYIQCPCNDTTIRSRSTDGGSSPSSRDSADEDDERPFDPRSPRSNYSLYPLEYLLYCDVCHQIRCPRCVAEELVTIYCPNCLFEVGSSSIKTEGNRCTRSCFQCPICIGPLAVQSLESAPESSLLTAESASATPQSGPWILACSYCNWNSAEIGVKFDKPQGIFSQLSKLRHGEDHSKHSSTGDVSPKKIDPVPETASARFAAMKSFYNAQNNTNSPSSNSLSNLMDYGLSSPGALTRIMNLYSGNNAGLGKPKAKSSIMREADSASEGFRVADLDESAAMSKLRRDGWDGTVTRDQSQLQVEEGARFADELWPIPYLLRTKRSKRCPVCRHIISKPESKVGNTRWRIRLVANNNIPSITIKPLNPAPSTPGTSDPLIPLQPAQFLLTFKNPMFEEIKVTLATPATTPGRFSSRVTILCPQFHIDANTDTDMYLDDVLKDGEKGAGRKRGDESTSQQAEAGKIWERGRNWVSIVVEVIPASLRGEEPSSFGAPKSEPPLKEGEDILEIPMLIRLEWEGEASQDQVGASAGKEKDTREKKELAYWSAIGLGRISQE
ncbi:dynactin p62 [Daldinia sp. FL1419]|nr:dynactin p62 [Daldinia sp. FL1419]